MDSDGDTDSTGSELEVRVECSVYEIQGGGQCHCVPLYHDY